MQEKRTVRFVADSVIRNNEAKARVASSIDTKHVSQHVAKLS